MGTYYHSDSRYSICPATWVIDCCELSSCASGSGGFGSGGSGSGGSGLGVSGSCASGSGISGSIVFILPIASVSNGSSFGPGGYYRSVWQRPYPIKNRRFFKRTITLRPQILIREFSVWYVKYAALHGASFGRLRFSISLILSKWQPKNLVFTPKMTIISKQLAEF